MGLARVRIRRDETTRDDARTRSVARADDARKTTRDVTRRRSTMAMATTATATATATTRATTSMNARARRAMTSFGRATTTTATATATRGRRRDATTTTAFLNFGGGKGGAGGTTDATPYVCVDCGYVYRGGDFKKLPNSYRCPTCNVGKNRFKAQGGSSLLAQKKANKEAFRARREAASKGGKATSGREALKQKMMDAQAEKDKKRGWF